MSEQAQPATSPNGTIYDLLSFIRQRSIAPNNRYRLTITPPACLVSTNQSNELNAIQIMCTSLQIPGYNIRTSVRNTGSETRKIPYARTNGDVDVVFTSSGLMEERKFLDKWVVGMLQENMEIAFYDDIITDITIEVLNQSNETIYEYILKECYPITVNSIGLDRKSTNEAQSFQVTFYYWKIETKDLISQSEYDAVSFITNAYPPGAVGQPGLPDSNQVSPAVSGILAQINYIKLEVSSGQLEPSGAISLLANIQQNILTQSTLSTQDESIINQYISSLQSALGSTTSTDITE
jgi:hypothetical protein